MGSNKNVPAAKDSDRLVTKENGLKILDLEHMLFVLAVNSIVFEHVDLKWGRKKYNQTEIKILLARITKGTKGR